MEALKPLTLYDEGYIGEAGSAIDYWQGVLLKPYFVYFIQEHDGPAKIGKARNPRARLVELQCGNPRPLLIRAALVARPETESRLHRALKAYRVGGEWFADGLEQAIVTAAQHASVQQIAWYRDGKPIDYVIEGGANLVMKPAPTLEVAA